MLLQRKPPWRPGAASCSGPEFTARPVHLYFSCVFLVNTNAYLERVDSSRPFCWTDAAFCPTTLAFKSTPELTRVHLCPHCVDSPPPPTYKRKCQKSAGGIFFAECPRFFLSHRFNIGLFLFSKEAEHSLAVFHNSSTRRSLAKEFFFFSWKFNVYCAHVDQWQLPGNCGFNCKKRKTSKKFCFAVTCEKLYRFLKRKRLLCANCEMNEIHLSPAFLQQQQNR